MSWILCVSWGLNAVIVPYRSGGWFNIKMISYQYRKSHCGDKLVPYRSGGWINIKMTSYHYRNSHCGDKTILRPSYLHNGISYTGKNSSLYWIRALYTWPDIEISSQSVSSQMTHDIAFITSYFKWAEGTHWIEWLCWRDLTRMFISLCKKTLYSTVLFPTTVVTKRCDMW